MQIDLVPSLREQPLEHPTRIVRWVCEGRTIRAFVVGRPWWIRNPPHGAETGILLTFENVMGGRLDLDAALEFSDDEALEQLDVTRLADHDWAKPPRAEIYCSSPLPDPIAVYLAVESWLACAEGCQPIHDVLNMGTHASLAGFLEIARSSTYLLLRGPESLTRIVCQELDRQAVPYTAHAPVLRPRPDGDLLLVRFGSACFICGRAVAELAS